ncbi:hypothetical protein [Micromonospora endophytica]|uniref:Uncharacterized protein n=1 Tax=Micromonospora endophytica TaxID=515350 RepID=A0A2W2D0H1_9ACTN|nr:hypothetical protein [Micromonospora endophytica]PZF86003.1 hypothetical protein C1I93_28150 [Micromonospora endophytica]RIW45441.1 hypothetical protein D3H59_15270 [Micromonospora endophytica]BCJ58579.1 hypothetical protein Jiend_20010 [Micromonospora endophytica]
MRTAAETEVRRPSAVRALTTLLAVTAAATVVVEVLNWWYAPEQGFGLAVRTGWAMLRSFGFLLLIGHVRRGRTVARPLGLILAVTTVFAVGRLVVPRHGVPPLPGLLGFVLLTVLCVTVLWLLYRSSAVAGHLVRHRPRLVIDRSGISWRELPPRRPEASAWLLTSRVAAFTYSPLMLVPALVAGAAILDGRLLAVPAVLFWLGAGIATSYLVLFCTAFLLRGKRWAGTLLVVITVGVLAVHLPLCWWLLGIDGLVRDGAPLVAAAVLALYGVRRAARASGPATPP